MFGSNEAGVHGRGAAKTALKFGARYGQGDGVQGQAYGISTKDRHLQVLSLSAIGIKIDRFMRYALAHQDQTFLVTQIGCGLAGYRPSDIATMFFRNVIPSNVRLPAEFIRLKSV